MTDGETLLIIHTHPVIGLGDWVVWWLRLKIDKLTKVLQGGENLVTLITSGFYAYNYQSAHHAQSSTRRVRVGTPRFEFETVLASFLLSYLVSLSVWGRVVRSSVGTDERREIRQNVLIRSGDDKQSCGCREREKWNTKNSSSRAKKLAGGTSEG